MTLSFRKESNMAEDSSHLHQAPSTSEPVEAESRVEEAAPDPDEDDLDGLDGEGLRLPIASPSTDVE